MAAPETVVSDLRSPLIAALYLVMLPLWLLLWTNRLGAGAGGDLTTIGYGVLVVVSIPLFFRGVGLVRQRVVADASGVGLLGPGGFTVAWSEVASLKAEPQQRAANVVLELAGGRTVPSEYLVGRTRRRRIGVEPGRVGDLLALAATHGVHDGGTTRQPTDGDGGVH